MQKFLLLEPDGTLADWWAEVKTSHQVLPLVRQAVGGRFGVRGLGPDIDMYVDEDGMLEKQQNVPAMLIASLFGYEEKFYGTVMFCGYFALDITGLDDKALHFLRSIWVSLMTRLNRD